MATDYELVLTEDYDAFDNVYPATLTFEAEEDGFLTITPRGNLQPAYSATVLFAGEVEQGTHEIPVLVYCEYEPKNLAVGVEFNVPDYSNLVQPEESTDE